MDHEELVRRYSQKPEDMTPEQQAEWDAVIQRMQDKRDRGEVLQSWSKENFPIGLDSNFEPFPLSEDTEKPERPEQQGGQA